MSGFGLIVFLNAAALATLVGTGLLRSYALRVELVDYANDRSSHSMPTPRGGGASIVVTTIVGLAISPVLFDVDDRVAIGLCGGGALVALIGWLDDHGHIRARSRLLCHSAGTAWLLWWVGPLSLSSLAVWSAGWQSVDYILSGLFVCWMINLFNFMDGLDGLAAGQAMAVAAAGALLLVVAGFGTIAALTPALLLCATVAGFLPWNWPPARIFMGDASSGFLGFMLASLAVVAGHIRPQLGIAWGILPGVFLADATITLITRFARRERVYEAHRSHAYQIWSRRFGQHLPITVGVNATTLLWPFPIAYLVAIGVVDPLAGTTIVMATLSAAAFALGAGRVRS